MKFRIIPKSLYKISESPKKMNYSGIIYIICISSIISIPAFALSGDIYPDVYESDDTFAQATIITLNNKQPSLIHNFHQEKDEDWLKFYGIPGETYTTKVYNTGTECNPVIQLYDTDGITVLKSRDNGTKGENEIMDWDCSREGIYYVRISHSVSSGFGEDMTYQSDIFRPHSCSTVIISGTINDAVSEKGIKEVWIKTNENDSAISGTDGKYKIIVCDFANNMTFKADGYDTFTETITITSPEMTYNDVIMNSTGYSSVIQIKNDSIEGISYTEWQLTKNTNIIVNNWSGTIGIGSHAETKTTFYYPSRYSVKLELWKVDKDKWEGPLIKDIRQEGEERYEWIIAINPHGNIPPPDPRTSTICWNTEKLNPTGFYRLRKGYDGKGEVAVDDMRITTEYDLIGKDEVQYFTVEFTRSDNKIKGDIDGNGIVELKDSILALKILTGINDDTIWTSYDILSDIDADGDNRIGMAEVIYILQVSVNIRP